MNSVKPMINAFLTVVMISCMPVGLDGVAPVAGLKHVCQKDGDNFKVLFETRLWPQSGLGASKEDVDGLCTAPASQAQVIDGKSAQVKSIAAGTRHTCALLATGDMKCWGRGFRGQL